MYREVARSSTDWLMSKGMLASTATIEVVAETLEEYDVQVIVLDPVCDQMMKNKRLSLSDS